MKQYRRRIEKGGSGFVELEGEEPEDMWHVYNLIQEGDAVRASTWRKVTTESATGTSNSHRVAITLTVRVETIDYDQEKGLLNVKGRNEEENQYVKLGAYHTLDLGTRGRFRIHKDEWDIIHLGRIDMAVNVANKADLAAVVMQEGLASVCLLTAYTTVVKAKIEVNIPRKRRGFVAQHEKGLTKFYDQIIRSIMTLNFDVVKCVVLASPGFVREQFLTYMMAQAGKEPELKVLHLNRTKFVSVHSTSGFKHALHEVLADPAVVSRLTDTKAVAEVKALADFNTMLGTDPDKAFYGYNHVKIACDALAIDTLLISDNLFRNKDYAARKKYVNLVETVRDQGSICHIFSSLHVSGESLDALTGIAAILRFPMPQIEDEDSDSDDAE